MEGLPPTPDVITIATKQLERPMRWASLPVRPLLNPRNLISQSRGCLTSKRSTNDVTPAHAKHVRSLVQCFYQICQYPRAKAHLQHHARIRSIGTKFDVRVCGRVFGLRTWSTSVAQTMPSNAGCISVT